MLRVAAVAGTFLMFVIGMMNGAKIGSAARAPFDYTSAPLEEKRQWLERQAAPLAKEIGANLPNGRGPAPAMKIKGTRVDARSNTINIDIQFKGRAALVENAKAIQRETTEKLCPEYARLPIGQNRIYVLQNFFYSNGQHAMTVGTTPITCRKFL